jgi:hypothetical protein
LLHRRCDGDAAAARNGVRSDRRQRSDRLLLSISEHSAGIFWQQPAAPDAAAEQLVAAAVAPDGRSGAPDAVAAAGPPEGVAARPFGAVAVLASPSAEPDAAGVAAQPGVVAQPVEFAAEASARPAESALEALLRP